MQTANAYAYATAMPGEIRGWLADQFDRAPEHVRGALARMHRDIVDNNRARGVTTPHRDANIEIREYVDAISGGVLPSDTSNSQIKRWAKNRARDCEAAVNARAGDELDSYAAAHNICVAFDIKPPSTRQHGAAGAVARMVCPLWWRRQGRVAIGRNHEQQARHIGMVHKKAGLYISNDGMKRWRGRQAANAQALAETIATCEETGQQMTLAEIAETGQANPANRRAELMTRIRGAEDWANRRDHAALFVTWTLPSNKHAVDSRTLKTGIGRNVTPRDGQEWLCRQWARARANLKRNDINVYGLRVAEPHHDGTPHWHLLLFVPKDQRDQLDATLNRYALDGATDTARKKHACTIVDIDRSRGSATGYVAKYVAKAIDGHRAGYATTTEPDGKQQAIEQEPDEAAARVRAWASQWGIRQFQFMGLPNIGPWRELRRLDRIRHNPAAENLRNAADTADFAGYIEQMGGVCIREKDRPARVRYVPEPGYGRYGDPLRRAFVECHGRPYMSRPLTWTIEYRPQAAGQAQRAAWTRVNNCTDQRNHGLETTNHTIALARGPNSTSTADGGTGITGNCARYFHDSATHGEAHREHRAQHWH